MGKLCDALHSKRRRFDSKSLHKSACNKCTLLLDNKRYIDANSDAPDNAISGNEP